MNLVKTTVYTSISTAVTFIAGFIIAKVVAVKIGPSGIAMVGQFQNAIAIFTVLGSGAINTGVVKYLAENYQNHSARQQIINHALTIVVSFSLLVSLFVLFFSSQLSRSTFQSDEYSVVFFLFGVFLVLLSLNTLFSSIFNGLQQIRKLAFSNITLAVSGIIFTTTFALFFGVKGVLMAINATAVVVLLVNYTLFRRVENTTLSFVFKKPDNALLKKLFSFSLMSGVSAFVVPTSQLLIRNKIIHDYSFVSAGYWQGVTKISDYYLSFMTTVLSVYYVPKLSQLTEDLAIKKEILNGYKLVLPAVIFLSFFIWLFRKYIISILFSDSFQPMQELFQYQLIGDVVKMAAWMLAYLMWAKAMLKPFIITEIFFSFSFVALAYFFSEQNGLIGITQAFALNYLLYFIVLLFIMRRYLFAKKATGAMEVH